MAAALNLSQKQTPSSTSFKPDCHWCVPKNRFQHHVGYAAALFDPLLHESFWSFCLFIELLFQASLEEADVRVNELKKTMYEFERDICKGAVNVRTNKIIAEKVVRHFEDKMKARVR